MKHKMPLWLKLIVFVVSWLLCFAIAEIFGVRPLVIVTATWVFYWGATKDINWLEESEVRK